MEWSGEAQFVVDCAHAGMRGAQVEAVPQGLEWDRVRAIAQRHRIVPLVVEALEDPESGHEAGAIPRSVYESLQERAQFVAQQNLRLTNEVASLAATFREAGVRAIPYRGPVTATVAYGDVGRREFGDLDFLVSRTDLSRARSVLTDGAYEPAYVRDGTERLSRGQRWAYDRFVRDVAFEHRSQPIEVELHWRVLARRFPTGLELESVWDDRTTLSIAGTEVPVLSPADRLVLACVHGTRHRWDRLRWICDVAASLETESIDWDAVGRRAQAHSCERMVALGLAVATDLFDAPLPAWVQRTIDEDPAIDSLCEHVRRHLFSTDPYREIDLWRFQARTLDRRRDRATFWTRCLLNPTRPDIERYAFPLALAPLYSAVRCLRIVRRAAPIPFGTNRTSRETPAGGTRE